MTRNPAVEQRRRTLQRRLNELRQPSPERENLKVETFPDLFDQLNSAAEHELAIHLVDRNARLVHEIESALARMGEGAYGLCESCEEPIAAKRLDAVPWARQCIACQSREEMAQAQRGRYVATAA